MSEDQKKVLTVLIQSLVTALLLFVQSCLTGCVTAQGDANVNKQTDINLSVPQMSFKDYSYLQEFFPENYAYGVHLCDVNPSNIKYFDILKKFYDAGVRSDEEFFNIMTENGLSVPVLISESYYGN